MLCLLIENKDITARESSWKKKLDGLKACLRGLFCPVVTSFTLFR